MRRVAKTVAVLGVLLLSLVVSRPATAQSFPLDSIEGLQPHGVELKPVVYQGRKAVQGMPSVAADAEWAAHPTGSGGSMLFFQKSNFITGPLSWTSQESRGLEHRGRLAGCGFGVSRELPKRQSMSMPMSVQRMAVRTISFGEIIRRSIALSLITSGRGCGRNLQVNTNRMWIWCRANGQRSGSK